MVIVVTIPKSPWLNSLMVFFSHFSDDMRSQVRRQGQSGGSAAESFMDSDFGICDHNQEKNKHDSRFGSIHL